MHHHHQMLFLSRAWTGSIAPEAPRAGWTRTRDGSGAVIAALFACFFAAQSGQLALTPVLTDAAAAFGLSTSGAGQIRSLAAVVGAVVAVALVVGGHRVALKPLLRAGLVLIVAGSGLSLGADSVAVLTAGQALVGAASSIVMAAGVAAAASWSSPAERGRVVAWTLVGAPAAWVVAMPVTGVVARADWRLAFAVPVAAAATAAAILRRAAASSERRPGSGFENVLADTSIRAWAVGETLSYAAWSGVLVYAGALLVESYGISLTHVGLALGLGAAAYIPGTFAAQRAAVRRDGGTLLATVGLVLAPAVIAFGSLRAGAWPTTAAFGALCFLAGARTYLGSAVGLTLSGERHAAAMSVRGAAAQVGWIVGSVTGGLALAAGGYGLVGLALGLLFAAGAVSHRRALATIRPRARARSSAPRRLERGGAPVRAR